MAFRGRSRGYGGGGRGYCYVSTLEYSFLLCFFLPDGSELRPITIHPPQFHVVRGTVRIRMDGELKHAFCCGSNRDFGHKGKAVAL
jgi:hypothetical protein